MNMVTASSEMCGLAIAHLEQELKDRVHRFPEAETLVRLTLARLYLDDGQ
ncbi:MAG: hypothetical protein ACI89X_004549 [Planctomycetota bacterium]|jgi:hypothetical protein